MSHIAAKGYNSNNECKSRMGIVLSQPVSQHLVKIFLLDFVPVGSVTPVLPIVELKIVTCDSVIIRETYQFFDTQQECINKVVVKIREGIISIASFPITI